MSERTAERILPHLGLKSLAELDTDNPLGDPRVAIRRLLDDVPDSELPGLLQELKQRFGSSE